MQLQIVLPNESPATDPAQIIGLARRAEQLGFHTVWLPDHLLPPGEYGVEFGGVHEALVMLGAIAAVTTHIRLGTSVLILPLRNPFVVAKQVATVERLAPGRVILGVGTGWQEQEFANVGARFTRRGARTDNALRLIRHLWSVGHGPFDNAEFGFETGIFQPRPTAPIPIMVGGTSNAAMRRVAEFADAWQAVGLEADQFPARAATLQQTDRAISVGARLSWPELPADPTGEIGAWRDAGAAELAVWLGAVDGYMDRMEALARAADVAG